MKIMKTTTAKPIGPCAFDKVTRRIAELVEPYREICDLTESEFPVDDEDQNGEFIADAFTVYHETGLTPRELVEAIQSYHASMELVLSVMGEAYERFTDNDMVPPNEMLKKWLAKARVCQQQAHPQKALSAIQNANQNQEGVRG